MNTKMQSSDRNNTQINAVDAATLAQWLKEGKAVLVDVREPVEHKQERIADAMLLPLSRFDPSQLPDPKGKRLVLHCKSGSRSLMACKKIEAQGAAGEVWNLTGGITAWKQANLKTLQSATPGGLRSDIQRQTQLTIGLGVVAGTLLGAFVHPLWLIVPGMMGGGLMMAGSTGLCPLAILIARMPWNSCASSKSCCGTAAD